MNLSPYGDNIELFLVNMWSEIYFRAMIFPGNDGFLLDSRARIVILFGKERCATGFRGPHKNTGMQHFKLNFRNRPLRDQLVHCEQHAQNIGGLPAASRTQVDLAQLTGAVAAARESFDLVELLRSQLKEEVVRRNQLVRAAREHTSRALGWVALNTGQQPSALLAAGLQLKAPKRPLGVPAAPTDFRAMPHEEEGRVQLSWKRPLRRCGFRIEMRKDGESEWKVLESAVATKTLIGGLKSGMKYWFRVGAFNARGHGPSSNPVGVRVK